MSYKSTSPVMDLFLERLFSRVNQLPIAFRHLPFAVLIGSLTGRERMASTQTNYGCDRRAICNNLIARACIITRARLRRARFVLKVAYSRKTKLASKY